ncbi:MAG TPA: hypothetical protein DEP05_06190 [Betaproteobacteria bacterium]|nr:hypothetical protein [Betaproteobacteria bacterium]
MRQLAPRALIKLYQPLRVYLAQRLKRPVFIVTAPNFRAYLKRTEAREYPVIITAPHFGRLVQLDAGYRPMLVGKFKSQGVLVTAKHGGIQRIQDLAGKSVATPDLLALNTMLGEALLRAHGLESGRNVTLRPFNSHASAALSVLRGDNAAAVIGKVPFSQLPAAVRDRLRVLAFTGKAPHLLYMASPALSTAEAAKLKRVMLEFVEKTHAGAQFMKRLRAGGWRSPTAEDMKDLDPFARNVRLLLKKASQ